MKIISSNRINKWVSHPAEFIPGVYSVDFFVIHKQNIFDQLPFTTFLEAKCIPNIFGSYITYLNCFFGNKTVIPIKPVIKEIQFSSSNQKYFKVFNARMEWIMQKNILINTNDVIWDPTNLISRT
jgi:hypothetical protein